MRSIGPRSYVLDLSLVLDIICRVIIRDVDHRDPQTDVEWLAGVIPTAERIWPRRSGRRSVPRSCRIAAAIRLWETVKNGPEVRGHRLRRGTGTVELRMRYTAHHRVLTQDEARRFISDGAGDPETDITLAWEPLYRIEPDRYDR